ncbi:DNA translocase FtsK 4TM domain-containing protein [Patescibacteria group bacterium]
MLCSSGAGPPTPPAGGYGGTSKNMFRRKNKNKKILPGFTLGTGARQGIWILLLIISCIVIILAFLGKAGPTGNTLDQYLSLFFGWTKWLMPIILVLSAFSLVGEEEKQFDSSNVFGLFLFFVSFSGIFYFWDTAQSGGIAGSLITPWLIQYIGEWTTAALLSTGVIISLLLILDTSLSALLGKDSLIFKIILYSLVLIAAPFTKRRVGDESFDHAQDRDEGDEDGEVKGSDKKAVVKEYDVHEEDQGEDQADEDQNDHPTPDPPLIRGGSEGGVKGFDWIKSNIKIKFPIDLLKASPKRPTSGNINKNQSIIKKTLWDFGIPISLGEVRVGPTVTQYTFKPSRGIPVSRVKALSDDLALNLALHPVRIEAPIPGKPLVGLEVPNQVKVLVTLKEMLQSKAFKAKRSNTTVALGRDVTGQVWFDDLVKCPHLLVAGATNSGKSVCLHSMITSLLFQNNPDDLKLILIDVKQVELTIYNGLPYLITPVVTDNKRAIRALTWCLTEMDRRLEILGEAGCQNIGDYNKRKKFNRMPYLVVVVDELGDLLSTARKEAESAIIRLGQKARAAGIHLVLATQRPSVDILSGLIKANMPARIAFSVTSSINSKTILDFTGAEKLLGQGDMLFINSSLSKPVRIQGAYIGKDEIKAVVKYARSKVGSPKYIDEIVGKTQENFDFDSHEVDDEMLEEAKQMILDTNRASASMLQSRLAIGYPRANRILDILEKQGVVGPSIQNKPREVLVNK